MFITIDVSDLEDSKGFKKNREYKSDRFYSIKIKTIEDLLQHTLLNVDKGCMEWIHGKDSYGYGKATYKNKPIGTHRLAYILSHNNFDVPTEIFVCHSCDNPSCINPEHLFLGTILTNNQDSKKKGRRYHQKLTTCPQGHPKIEENLLRSKRKDGRERVECRVCNKETSFKRYYKKTYGFDVEKDSLGRWVKKQ